MKKLLLLSLIIFAACVDVYLGFRRTPYSIARHFTDFDIPSTCKVVTFQDQWANNPGGPAYGRLNYESAN